MYDKALEAKKKSIETTSLFQSIQHTTRNGTNSACELFRKFGAIICCSASMVIIMAILMAIPIFMIVTGSLNLKNCPIQNLIPIWLIVIGSLSVIKNLSTLIQRINILNNKKKKKADKAGSSTIVNIVDSLLAAFLIIWFLVGNYWVYSVTGTVQFIDNSTNVTNITSTFDINRNETITSFYCDRLTYELSFWVITTLHMIIGLSCLLFCFSVCFTICLSPKK